jgi:hypothetical protein
MAVFPESHRKIRLCRVRRCLHLQRF